MERTKDLRVKIVGVAVAVLMMCFLFVQLSIVSFAAEGKVTAQAAKIRASASTSSDQVGSAIRGEKYTITGEETGADGYVWYKITFDGNKTGYIRSDLMEKSGEVSGGGAAINPSVEVTDVQPVSATITGSSVRVRSDASTSGSIIAGVVRDYVVTVNGKATDSQGKTWYRVTYSAENGEITGFIREDFLSVSGSITPVTDTPVVNDPVVNDPVVSEPGTSDTPQTTTPSTSVKAFEVIEEEGVWKLVDNTAGKKYNASALIKANEVNPPKIEELEGKVTSQNRWIVFLVVLVIVLGILVTLLFLKVKDVMDEAYFTAVEKETIRQRQGQKANNNAAKNKPVMQTVGNGNGSGNKQGVPKTTSVPKPNGANGTRPVQQKQAGAAPQTVKVSNPADTRAPKPVNQQRPAGAQQRPASAQNVQRAAAPAGQQPRPVQNGQQGKTVAPNGQQPRPVQQRPVENTNKQSWQSKNFVADEDEDFEFEFLNWDGNEEN
ncbi:MAG: SH3 domain-containing protein [Lachnospiraceae bacterium]|nr:SH3 domain-containing protein [Lachnospiraceae bacterium]